jgi:hypothetical protein
MIKASNDAIIVGAGIVGADPSAKDGSRPSKRSEMHYARIPGIQGAMQHQTEMNFRMLFPLPVAHWSVFGKGTAQPRLFVLPIPPRLSFYNRDSFRQRQKKLITPFVWRRMLLRSTAAHPGVRAELCCATSRRELKRSRRSDRSCGPGDCTAASPSAG